MVEERSNSCPGKVFLKPFWEFHQRFYVNLMMKAIGDDGNISIMQCMTKLILPDLVMDVWNIWEVLLFTFRYI